MPAHLHLCSCHSLWLGHPSSDIWGSRSVTDSSTLLCLLPLSQVQMAISALSTGLLENHVLWAGKIQMQRAVVQRNRGRKGHQGWLQPMVTLQNGDPKGPELLLLIPLETRALISSWRSQPTGWTKWGAVGVKTPGVEHVERARSRRQDLQRVLIPPLLVLGLVKPP